MSNIYIQIAALIFTISVTVGGTTWAISALLHSHEVKLTKIISEHQVSDNKEFANIRYEISAQRDHLQREFGETGHALRQGIHNLELALAENKTSNLETFARRQSVYHDVQKMSDNLKLVDDKLDNLILQVAKIEPSERKR